MARANRRDTTTPIRLLRVGKPTVVLVGAALVAPTAGCSGDTWNGPFGALGGDSESSATSSASITSSVTPPEQPTGTAAAADKPTAASPTTTAATASPSISLAVLVPPNLGPAKGYTYAKAPPAVAKAFAPVAAGYGGVLSAPTIRAAVRAKESVGSVAAMSVEPSHLEDSDVVASLLTGLVKGMSGKGYTLRTRTVEAGGGTHKVVVAFRQGSTIAAWLDQGCVVAFVSSEPEEAALVFARAYLSG